jgi:hypothetical protein
MDLPSYCGIRRFITVFTRAGHWSLFWDRWIQYTPLKRRSISTRLHSREDLRSHQDYVIFTFVKKCRFCIFMIVVIYETSGRKRSEYVQEELWSMLCIKRIYPIYFSFVCFFSLCPECVILPDTVCARSDMLLLQALHLILLFIQIVRACIMGYFYLQSWR